MEDNDLSSVLFSSLVASHSGRIYSCSLDSFLFTQSTNLGYTGSWVAVKLGVRSSTRGASGIAIPPFCAFLLYCSLQWGVSWFPFSYNQIRVELLSSSSPGFGIQVASLVFNVPER